MQVYVIMNHGSIMNNEVFLNYDKAVEVKKALLKERPYAYKDIFISVLQVVK